mmetsp:Transcript_69440/g.166470  ORF Transcript_69440/g.166470 Transcript_69440/m.166470 type:complete len:564 (+) Transcript_69440:140-1831(+)
MDVDVDNFDEVVKLLEDLLPKANFVAVDCEMTGIQAGPDSQSSPGDTPQERYWKGLKVVNKPLNLVQVGLSLFTETRGREAFECRSFSFYVFPRQVDELDANGHAIKEDQYIGLTTSTVTFLQDNGIDLGRWLSKGISYTSPATEEALMSKLASLESEAASTSRPPPREVPEPTSLADIKMVEDAMNKVQDMVEKALPEMMLPGMNNFLALIVRSRIDERYPSLLVEKRPSPSNPRIQDRWVVAMNEETRSARVKEARSRTMKLLGFRRVWRLLKERRAPVIVHNGWFDLLFLTAAFEGPLPHHLKDWKQMVTRALPYVFDTKYLAEDVPALRGSLGSRSALPELASALDEKLAQLTPTQDAPSGAAPALSFTSAEGCGFDGGGASWHNAAYDAFMTGKVFAYYRYLLGDDEVVTGYANHIFLMFSGFHIRLAQAADLFWMPGIVRFVHSMDHNFANNRSLQMMFKDIIDDGRRRVNFRWCGGRSGTLLLIVQGPDASEGDEGYSALEASFLQILKEQKASGRLDFCTLEEHLKGFDPDADREEKNDQEGAEDRPAKRLRAGS